MTARRRDIADLLRRDGPPPQWRPAVLLVGDIGVYLGLWAALVLTPGWRWKAVLSICCGVAIARLFLIGHDACHGAFFRSRRANAIAGRLVLLPSLTPYSTWELGHNTLHHGFTNLRGKDYVYTPFSRSEFDALPAWRRLLERIYRHPLGPGLHYGIEIWWRRLWFPRPAGKPVYFHDSLLTAASLVAHLVAVVMAAGATGQNPWTLAIWAMAVPFAVWNSLMGFVTYQQHTHPGVAWYSHRDEWDPVLAQVRGTVHVVFPPPFGALLDHIMEHTAHHLDVTVAMFDLPQAQRRIEAEFPGEVRIVRWSPAFYLECCRRCKLYDYATHTWLDFAGNPTGPSCAPVAPAVATSSAC